MVCATFDARTGHEAALAAVIARWVVLTRGMPGCRNVDFIAAATHPGRYRVIEKWEDPSTMRAHLDAPETAELAQEMLPMLSRPPEFELYDAISAHDLQ